MKTFISTLILLAGVAGSAAAVDVKEVKSPGGIKAYLNEDHGNQLVTIAYQFAGGAAIDPPAKGGLSNFAVALLDEGAGTRDSLAFQSELEDRSIRWRVSASQDSIDGTLTSTTDNLPVALDLLKSGLSQPRFDAEPVERIRKQILVSIKAASENPGKIAGDALMKAVFGDHPYSRNDDGTMESVAAITAADFKAWAKARFARDRLIVAASGDITAEQLGKALDQVFGVLPATTGLDVKVPEAVIPSKGSETRIEKRLPQSVIYVAQRGIRRNDPDWYTALLVDYVFGSGSFQSRLTDEIREKRGLAYSVSSSLSPLDAGAFMMAGAGTRADKADETVKLLRDEWRKLRDGGITEDELKGAKDYLTGAWPLRFTATAAIAQTLIAVQRDKLGIDYLDKRNSLIEKVTLADANRFAKSLYDPDGLQVVVVGPKVPPQPAK